LSVFGPTDAEGVAQRVPTATSRQCDPSGVREKSEPCGNAPLALILTLRLADMESGVMAGVNRPGNGAGWR
jgi:hypothetical protein